MEGDVVVFNAKATSLVCRCNLEVNEPEIGVRLEERVAHERTMGHIGTRREVSCEQWMRRETQSQHAAQVLT